MDQRALLDSNIVIGMMNGSIHPNTLRSLGDHAVSAVSVMEVYALGGMSEQEQRLADIVLRLIDVIPVDAEIGRMAGMLARTRRRGRPDLLIAATALVYDYALVTRNARDFRGIPGLRVQKL